MSAPRSGLKVEALAATGPVGCLACAGRDRCRVLRCHRLSARERLACADVAYRAAKQAARPSPLVSSHIHTAPGRGPMQVLRQTETVRTPTGHHTRPVTRDGFHAAIRADAFDLMERQAKRRKTDAPALFTKAQVDAGRAYAALSERVAAEGVKCSSLERGHGGEGGSLDWIEGVMARSARLSRMHAVIGSGVALVPRGHQAHADRGRIAIRVRTLVDEVCCQGRTLSDVLRRHGWSAKTGTLALLRRELTLALDRLWGV